MAELMVKVQYASPVRSTLLAGLRLGFPLWGVILPIVGAICFVIFICALSAKSANAEDIMRFLGLALAGVVLPATCLLATRTLSMDCIVADKNGLQLPLALDNLKRYIAWNSIRMAKVLPAADTDFRSQTLVLLTDTGKKVGLKLSRLKQAEVEQLLLAIEMWADKCERDPSILTLKDSLKSNALGVGAADGSYTQMWEEELRRRFCATAFMPLEPGTGLRNGTLRVIRQLALGGLSALYLCQLEDKKLVVIKEAVVPEDSPENVRMKAKEMFEREATLLMKLNHSNIVKVLDCFTDNGRNYMMLEYVSGQDIRQFIKQNGPQKDHVIVEWAIQMANILKHLHEQDPAIIHRDITPDNLVLREDGAVVLIDFGAANELIGNATGTFVGKQSFIAPEQFRGHAIVQSDIYAFGCTLYFLLTGQEPEALSSSSPREIKEDISEELDEFVNCCTQLDPKDRFQSAAQMLPVLKKMAASMLVT